MNNKDLINIFDFNKYMNIVKCLQNDFTDIIFFSLWGEGQIFYELLVFT